MGIATKIIIIAPFTFMSLVIKTLYKMEEQCDTVVKDFDSDAKGSIPKYLFPLLLALLLHLTCG